MRDGCERGLTRTTRTALTPLGLRKRCCSRSGTPFAVPRAPRSVVRGSKLSTRLSTRGIELRAPVRSFGDAATARQSCLGSARARPAVHAYLSMPRDQRARDASGRRLQSTCQRRAPVDPRGFRLRVRGGPRSHRRTVPARGDRPLWPFLRRSIGRCLPAGACRGARSADASVAARRARGSTLALCVRPRPLPPPPNVTGFGFHDPRHLPSIAGPSSSPSPILGGAFHRKPGHERCFARWQPRDHRRARLCPRFPAATGSRFSNRASPIDFCNLTRNPGTPRT